MVSIERQNIFELREYAVNRVFRGIGSDPFKSCFVRFLGLSDVPVDCIEFASLPLYQRCITSSLRVLEETISKSDLTRLLGQASRIDSTPMPWVSDWIGVMAIKWFVEQQSDAKMENQFQSWISEFVPQQIQSGRLNDLEGDIARYVQDSTSAVFSTATIPLFLHYHGTRILSGQRERKELITKFGSSPLIVNCVVNLRNFEPFSVGYGIFPI